MFFLKSSFQINYYKNEEIFLKEAIKAQPNYFLFQAQYAGKLLDRGDYVSAIEHYNIVIAKRPDKAEFFNDRGRAYFSLGNYDAAIKDISSAIKISGFEADYYLNRCAAYNALNEAENAMKDLYVLIKCCRETVPLELKNDIGIKWRRILKGISDSILITPSNDVLYYRRAKLYFDTGQKEKGFLDLKEALRLNPQNTKYKDVYFEHQK